MCMCIWGTSRVVNVKIPADLDRTGEIHWREKPIDSCIADLVLALQEGGIDMRGSCCGHGKDLGHIMLQDGRLLVITDREFHSREIAWGLKALWRGIRLTARGLWNRALYLTGRY